MVFTDKGDSLDWLAQRPKYLKNLCYEKSRTISRYPGFSGRFWFSYLSSLHNGQDCYNIQKCDPLFLTKIFLKIDASDKAHFEVFPKEKGRIFMPCFALVMLPLSCHALLWSCFHLCYPLPCFSWQNLHQRQKFSALQLIPHVLETKREIQYSPVTIHSLLFMTLFTPNFCLFKGGCPLSLKQVLL